MGLQCFSCISGKVNLTFWVVKLFVFTGAPKIGTSGYWDLALVGGVFSVFVKLITPHSEPRNLRFYWLLGPYWAPNNWLVLRCWMENLSFGR